MLYHKINVKCLFLKSTIYLNIRASQIFRIYLNFWNQQTRTSLDFKCHIRSLSLQDLLSKNKWLITHWTRQVNLRNIILTLVKKICISHKNLHGIGRKLKGKIRFCNCILYGNWKYSFSLFSYIVINFSNIFPFSINHYNKFIIITDIIFISIINA